MNSHLHTSVVAARLADLRRTAAQERQVHRAPPSRPPRRHALGGILRRRVLRPAA